VVKALSPEFPLISLFKFVEPLLTTPFLLWKCLGLCRQVQSWKSTRDCCL